MKRIATGIGAIAGIVLLSGCAYDYYDYPYSGDGYGYYDGGNYDGGYYGGDYYPQGSASFGFSYSDRGDRNYRGGYRGPYRDGRAYRRGFRR